MQRVPKGKTISIQEGQNMSQDAVRTVPGLETVVLIQYRLK